MAHVIQFIPMKEFPNRIFELRKARGWSQTDVGDLVGCSKMHVSGLERGDRELTLHWMQRFAEAFGVLPADILSAQDNPMQLSAEEREFIMRFRMADEATRDNLKRVSDALLPFKSASTNAA